MSGSAAYISRALRIAPSDPCIGSVNTISVPNALRIRFRSGVTLVGTQRRTRYPRAAPIIAYAMPVLPDVASRMILSRVSAPDFSPSWIIRSAGRSFTEPPGFFHSAFA